MSLILVIDDDVASCRTLQLHFASIGHKVRLAHNFDDGMAEAQSQPPDLIILDIRMPGKSGLEGLPELKAEFPDIPVIMITAFHDMEVTVQTMKRGADDYIDKPVDIDELDEAVAKALARSSPSEGEMSVGQVRYSKPGTNIMVGRSRAMKQVFKLIGLVAPKPTTVLISGESGTGKELVARALHNAGINPGGPFVAVNCAALVDALLESDLFGHERGAFTGAVNRQLGKFALARDGTIFLDEIGELSLAIQAKLLRVLQEKEYLPLGGKDVQSTNARVVAATNVDLTRRVEEGAFREDLYYRLQVVAVDLPPLRKRKEDLNNLVRTLLARINRDLRRNTTRVTADVLDAFRAYHWPGNVRELENVLMKAVSLCPGDVITSDFISSDICTQPKAEDVAGMQSLAQRSLVQVQKEHVARVLAATNWHRGRACEVLEISRPRLRRYIHQFRLQPPNGESPEYGDSDDASGTE